MATWDPFRITSGDQRIDDRKLATLLGVPRKQVKFATPAQCLEYFGYAPGAVPPIAHRRRPHAVYLDTSLKRYTQIYQAGGSSNAIFGVTLAQLAPNVRLLKLENCKHSAHRDQAEILTREGVKFIEQNR